MHLFAALSSDVESNATAVVSAWAQAAPLSLPTAQAERLAVSMLQAAGLWRGLEGGGCSAVRASLVDHSAWL